MLWTAPCGYAKALVIVTFLLLGQFQILLRPCSASPRPSHRWQASEDLAEKAIANGDYASAERILLSALQLAEDDHSEREVAESLVGLTRVSLSQRQYDKSEKYFQKTLSIVKHISAFLNHDPEIQVAVVDLYENYIALAKHHYPDKLKLSLIEHAVELKAPLMISAKKFDKGLFANLILIETYNVMHSDFADAERFQTLAVEIAKLNDNYDKRKSMLKVAYRVLGNIQVMEHKYAEAEYNYALELELSPSGDRFTPWDAGPPHVALANAFLEDGKLEQALAHAKVGMTLMEQVLGKDSPALAIDYYILGLIQEKLGQTTSADRSFKKSLAISGRTAQPSLLQEFAMPHLTNAHGASDKSNELFYRTWTFLPHPTPLEPTT
jgi:tetratricopeptide (TPR) repeat protein